MGFNFANNLKSKLAASVAILATVFSVLVGVAPAHATVYAPNAGSNRTEWTLGGGSTSQNYFKYFSVTGGPANSQVISLTATTRITSMDWLIPIKNDATSNAYFADGTSHWYAPNVTITDANSVTYPYSWYAITPFTLFGNFGSGFYQPTVTAGTGLNANMFQATIPTSAGAGTGGNYMEVKLGTVDLPPGVYTVSINVNRDGLPMDSSKFSTSNATYSYTSQTSDVASLAFPGNGLITPKVHTCIDTSLVAAGDVLTPHPLMDGSTWTATSPNYSWAAWNAGSYTTSTLTLTSAQIAAGIHVSYADQSGFPLSETGTHTPGLSITNQNGIEVTASCTPATNATVTNTASGPLGTVSTVVSGSLAGTYGVTVEYRDQANNALVASRNIGYNSSTSATFTFTAAQAAAAFTAGHTYDVRYSFTRTLSTTGTGITATSALSAASTFVYPAVSAPDVINGSATVGVRVPGITGVNSAYIALAYPAGSTSTPYSAASTTGTNGLATFTLGYTTGGLNYSTDYVFGYCVGTTIGSTITCTSAVSPLTASVTTASLAAPTATVSGTTVTIAGYGNALCSTNAGFAFYAASNTSSPIFTAGCTTMYTPSGSNISYSYSNLTGLSYGTNYVVKYCTSTTSSGSVYTCAGSISPASASFSFTAPAYGNTLTSPSNGNNLGDAVASSTTTTVGSYTNTYTDGLDGRFLVNATGSTWTVTHVTPAGLDTGFGGSGSVSITPPSGGFLTSFFWLGNHDKWLASINTGMSNVYVTGSFSNATQSSFTVSSNTLTAGYWQACAAAYPGATSAMPMTIVPNAMGQILVTGSCYIPYTYSDSSTATAPGFQVPVLFKVTGADQATVVGSFYTPNASTNLYWAASGASLTASVNPNATGTDVAAIWLLATAGKSGFSVLNSTLTSANLKMAVLRADGTFNVVDMATTISLSGGLPAKTFALAEQNNGSTVWGTSFQSGNYALAKLDLSTPALSETAFTYDTATLGGSTPITGVLSNFIGGNSGTISLFRRVSGTSPVKFAWATVDAATGAVTTHEIVSLAYTTSGAGTWSALTMSPTNGASLIYSGSLTSVKSAYWRATTVSGGPSTDATATFTVNGTTAHNGDTINVSNSSTSASVIVTANESHATVGPVTGSSSLAIGNNTVSFTVTAQDGTTTQTYSFTVNRAAVVLPTYVLTLDKNSSSATGSVSPVSASVGWTVPSNGYSLTGYSFNGWNTLANGNGTSYAAGAAISLSADTTLYAQWLIDPFVLSFDANTGTGSMSNISARSGWTIPGTVGFSKSGYLFAGWNTAANRSGNAYNPGAAITLTANQTLYAQWDVLPSDAVLCAAGTFGTHGGYGSATSSWTCDPAPLGSYVSLTGALSASLCPAGYFAAVTGATSCTPAQSGFFVATAGASAQAACPGNWISDAAAIICHSPRELSHNTKATFSIGGKSAANGGVIELTGLPSSLGVLVNLADNRSSATISVPANPVIGNNTVTVFVYAEDGSVQESNFTVHIAAPVVTPPVVVPPTPKPSSDATATIKANGSAITDGATINLAAGTTSVSVAVTPTESHATYSVSGASTLATGSNAVTVTVTAQDGTKKVYSFTAVVAAPLSTDATATITVAGIKVADGDHVNLPFGTSQVAVLVTPTESHATYVVSGATGLTTGTSVLTVTVTAQDGTTKTYSFQLVVAADTTPVNVTGAAATALDRVKAALAAGRVAVVTFAAKGAAAHALVVNQIRAFKASARAAGITGRISFTITDASSAASAVVRVG